MVATLLLVVLFPLLGRAKETDQEFLERLIRECYAGKKGHCRVALARTHSNKDPEVLLKLFNRLCGDQSLGFYCETHSDDPVASKFEIFREIEIGGLSKEQLLTRLSGSGIQFNKHATTLFNHHQFLPSAESENVTLVKVSLADLGLNDSCFIEEFETRASALGLKLCPLYLAAFLRLQYTNQPVGPYLTIASKKPEKDENYPSGFYIRNFENALCLRGYMADGFAGWPEQNEFIFINGSPSAQLDSILSGGSSL